MEEVQQQPPIEPQIPPANKSKKLLIIIGIVVFILAIGSGAYFFVIKSPSQQPIQSSQNNVQNIPENETPAEETPLRENINAGFEALYNTVVKPFYQARIQGNEQTALGYLGGNIGSGKYNLRNDIFSRLEKDGWKFINPDFKSFEVIYGGINPREKENKNAGDFVMRIIKKDNTFQDELIYVSTSIASIDYNQKGYSVVNYQNTPYLVLQTIERDSPTKQKVLLATKFFETGCTFYVSSDCSVLLEAAGMLKQLATISEVGQNSLFRWSNQNTNEIIFKKSFGEGGGAFESIESIDINSGTTKEIIKRTLGEVGPDDIFSNSAREIAKQECDYILSWERSNKDKNYIESFECKIKNSSSYNLYLVFNNKILKKETLSNTNENNFSLDIEKNIYNIDQFTFSFRGMNYLLDVKTGELKQN